jgi:gliding motility-associated-like protein
VVSYSLEGSDASGYVAPPDYNVFTGAITTKQLSISLPVVTLSKDYDGNANAVVEQLGSLQGLVSSDQVEVKAVAQYANNQSGINKVITVSYELEGRDKGNYIAPEDSNVSGGEIRKVKLTVTANDLLKEFDGQPFSGGNGVSYAGFVNQENETVLSGDLIYGGSSQGAINRGRYALIPSGLQADNYQFQYVEGMLTITGKEITASTVMVELNDELTYNGLGQEPKPIVKDAGIVLQEALDYELSYEDNIDAGLAIVRISGIGNYRFSRDESFRILPKKLTVEADLGQGKTYGSVDPVLSFTYRGEVLGETPKFDGSLSRVAGEIKGEYSILRGSLSLLNNEAFKASNYVIDMSSSAVSFEIRKAVLEVYVNDDSKFVTQQDPTGFYGVRIKGYVFGEDRAYIDETDLQIERTNASVEDVGEYKGVLIASGLSAFNYDFTYYPGDFTIVGADQLLVKIENSTSRYGDDLSFQVSSASYLSSSSQSIVDLLNTTSLTNNQVTVTDGTSGNAVFNIEIVGKQESGAGKLTVGTYKLSSKDLVKTTNSFDKLLVQGNVEILQKEVVAEVAEGKTKVYDGDVYMRNLSLSLSGTIAGDEVNGMGQGQYETKNVGETDYSLGGLNLSGADSRNYFIQGGATAFLIGSDGEISRRAITIVPNSGQFKYVGQTESRLLFKTSNEVSGEIPGMEGQLSRISGEDEGLYEIVLGTLQLSNNSAFQTFNYRIEIIPGVKFAIKSNSLNAVTMDFEPISAQVYTSEALEPRVVLKDGSKILEEGKDYEVSYSDNVEVGLASLKLFGIGNYIDLRTEFFKITAASLRIVADSKTKYYDLEDPELTYKATGLLGSDQLTGKLSREQGEDVGQYAITIGTLSAGKNYEIAFESAELSIVPIEIQKVFDLGKEAVAWGSQVSLPNEVSLMATNSRVYVVGVTWDLSSVNVFARGTYPLVGLLTAPSWLSNPNNLKGEIEIVVGAKKSPEDLLLSNNNFEANEIGVAVKIGEFQVIDNIDNQHELKLVSGQLDNNYFSIVQKSLSWTSSELLPERSRFKILVEVIDRDGNKIERTFDLEKKASLINNKSLNSTTISIEPISAQVYTSEALEPRVVLKDGSKILEEGKDYEVSYSDNVEVGLASLKLFGIGNYIDLRTEFFKITPASLRIVADSKTKYYDLEDPELTYKATGLLGSDQLTGKLSREQGEDVGQYAITIGTLSAGKNYEIAFESAELSIVPIEIQKVFDLGKEAVVWGSQVSLPNEVSLMATNSRVYVVGVTWDLSSVNVFARGTYPLVGLLTAPSWLSNPNNLKGEIEIVVGAKKSPEDLLLSNNNFEANEIGVAVKIGEFQVIDNIDNQHELKLVSGQLDNNYFSIVQKSLSWTSSELLPERSRFKILVEVIDRDGNKIERTFDLEKKAIPVLETEIFNTFSPNGDGINDTWGIPQLPGSSGVRIQVFDRGGERVFYTEDPNGRWDGTFQGKSMPVGTYFWTLDIRQTGETRRGILNLLSR